MGRRVVDLIGRKFGDWTVIEQAGMSRHGNTQWLCRCSCGNESIVAGGSLTTGGTRGCGHEGFRLHDLTGRRFGYLVVVAKARSLIPRKTKWICRCDCGMIVSVEAYNLINGHTTSCGCAKHDGRTKHGLSGTREHKCATQQRRRERKRRLDTGWTVQMEASLASFFQACVVCGSTYRLATDHVKPLSKGHGLKPGNAVRLCTRCNARKIDKDPDSLPSDMRNKITSAAEAFRLLWESKGEKS